MFIKNSKFFRWTILSALCGVLAGTASAIFLISLEWVTKTRDHWPFVIWGLPIAGLFIGWIYHRYGEEAAKGNNLILEQIHDPTKVIPFRMAPLVLGGTILTHLFGGSAGREGTAVQMGASLSDQLTHIFKVANEERNVLLVAGMGAGFASAIGAPWAGMIFGMEVIGIGRLRLFAWYECLVASFVAYYTAIFLGAPHSHFPRIENLDFSLKTALLVACAGVIFGVTAKLFSILTHSVEKFQKKLIPFMPLRPFVGGVTILGLFFLLGSFRYAGLGIPQIQQAFAEVSSVGDPIWKSIFTALTVGSGFKGGEFIPLVFIGTTLGSFLSTIIPISISLLAALGFAAVFAGAANTPIACTLMAMEIFGPEIGLYAALACFASYYCSGHHGIYKSQKVFVRKFQKVNALVSKLKE